MRVRLLSPAKLNLGLWVEGKREDGFHNILTVFHAVDLCDEMVIEEGIFGVDTYPPIPQEENLVYKGLVDFMKESGIDLELRVFIRKRIPEGAGLGGGSSNLATALKEANRILGEPFNLEELTEIALRHSSDAPFFFNPSTAIGRGRGEILRYVDIEPMEFTLLVPEVRSSTPRVYSALREEHFSSVDEDALIDALIRGDFTFLSNILGEIAVEIYPEIGEVVRFLEFCGYKPLVSGTGSAVFYIGKPDDAVLKGARARGWKVYHLRSWHGV